jgi:hypothetical protein
MRINQFIWLWLISLLVITSCNKIPKHANYIPKDALLVGAVDVNQLTKKMIWNAITGSALFDEMQKEIKNEKSKEAMKDFSSVGLNQSSSIYFFYTGNLRQDGKICFLVGMKNKAQFENFVKENLPGVAIQTKEKYNAAQLEESVFAAWNDDVAMFFPLKPAPTDSTMADGVNVDVAFNDLTAIEAFLSKAFVMDEKESVTSLPNFKTLHKAGHDVSIWANYEEIFKQNKELAAGTEAFMKADYLKNAALATGIDFEKGSTDIVMDYYFSDELAKIYDKYDMDNVDEKLIRQIPSNDVAMIMTYNLKPQMIQDMMKEFKLDGLINVGLMMMGTSMEKIGEAFKGDMVIALTDVNLTDTIQKIPNSDLELVVEPEMNFSMAMSVGSELALDELLNKGIKNNAIQKEGDMYKLGDAVLMKTKERLVISSKQPLATAYMNGKNDIEKSLPAGAWKDITGNPFSFFLDVKKIMRFISAENSTPEEKALMEETRNMFTYMEMHGGKLKNKANHMEGHLYFTNKEENSLVQLLNLAIKVKKQADSKSVPTTDTTLAI